MARPTEPTNSFSTADKFSSVMPKPRKQKSFLVKKRKDVPQRGRVSHSETLNGTQMRSRNARETDFPVTATTFVDCLGLGLWWETIHRRRDAAIWQKSTTRMHCFPFTAKSKLFQLSLDREGRLQCRTLLAIRVQTIFHRKMVYGVRQSRRCISAHKQHVALLAEINIISCTALQ